MDRLNSIMSNGEPSIVVVYGRRRVGKTELVEQAFRGRNVLKLEGLEGRSEEEQMQAVLEDLAEYLEQPLVQNLNLKSWRSIFKFIAEHIQQGQVTLYLEELQWLANYQDNLISDLKYVWDNYFRKNNDLILVLCGSAPSFMINQVLHSKALYSRSQFEFHVEEFSPIETQDFLARNKSKQEVMDAYLSIGGIPEYLKYLQTNSSVFLSLCENSFQKDANFVREYNRIFTSSLADNKHYRKTIEFLAKRKYATRDEIAVHLKIRPGGTLSELLEGLDQSGFIRRYTPYHLDEDSKLVRFAIDDNYLQFYFKFIKPQLRSIASGAFRQNPSKALKTTVYRKWLGFSFERFCRKYSWVIADILGFGGINYRSGAYYRRSKDSEPGFQIDLVFDRDDRVLTICEMKYLESKCRPSVIDEVEVKLSRMKRAESKTVERVLISANGADTNLLSRAYFDRVITLDDLMDTVYWR